MKTSLPIKKEFAYEKGTGPYTINFCYPQIGEPFIVKGRHSKAYDFLMSGLKCPILIHRKTYYEDTFLDINDELVKEKFSGNSHHVYTPHEMVRISELRIPRTPDELELVKNEKARRYFLRVDGHSIKAFRKVPRCWIKELDAIYPIQEKPKQVGIKFKVVKDREVDYQKLYRYYKPDDFITSIKDLDALLNNE